MQIELSKEFDLVYLNCIESALLLDSDITKENVDENVFFFSTKATILSWGETFKVKISEIDSSTVRVEVKSTANAQLFTWGKNNTNEKQFIETLKKILP